MKWLKAAGVGAAGSLVMFVIMMVGIHVTGIAPFNMAPSAAFLVSLGLPAKPLALIIHFGYGAMGSIALVALFNNRVDLKKGMGLGVILWLVMMFMYSPIIGWGIFGASGTPVDSDAPLYLEPGPKYPIMTLILHLIYGVIIGWLNPRWTLAD